jgi:hypothetical protein
MPGDIPLAEAGRFLSEARVGQALAAGNNMEVKLIFQKMGYADARPATCDDRAGKNAGRESLVAGPTKQRKKQ